jgi:hypothetical protein
MCWLALHRAGQAPRRLLPGRFPAELPRGALVAEIVPPGPCQGGLGLLGHRAPGCDDWWLALDVLADGRLRLATSRGGRELRLELGGWQAGTAEALRLSLVWDARRDDGRGAARGQTRLTLENPATGELRQAALDAALPVPGAALEGLFAAPDAHRDRAVSWFAAADHRHRPGPLPALGAGTRIDTPEGRRAIETLRAGDRVLTLDHGAQPVVWAGRARLPAAGGFAALGLLPPYRGLDRPLVVAPGQRLLLAGADIEDALGREEALAEARHLTDGETALALPGGGCRDWYGLAFAEPELIWAEGLPVESLYLGSLARRPALAEASLYAALARIGTLPLHRKPLRPHLSGSEARGIAMRRARARGPLAA